MAFRNVSKIVMLGLIAVFLAGCSALSGIETASKPLDTFELSPLSAGAVQASRGNRHLEVALPTATGALTSDRIVIKPTTLQVQALPNARWVDEATEHVQLLLVRSLANSGRFALVTAAGTGPQPDYELLTDLQAFQVEIAADNTTVAVRTAMVLLRGSDQAVISSRSFNNIVTVSDTSSSQVVAAFENAMTRQLTDIVSWLTETL